MMCIGWKDSGCQKVPLDGGGCQTATWFWVALVAVALMAKGKKSSGAGAAA